MTTNRNTTPGAKCPAGMQRTDKGLLFLRLFTATLLFTEAITKSQEFPLIENDYPTILGISSAQIVTITGLLELGAGVLLAMGLFVRPVAAVMTVVMFGAAFLFFPGQTFVQAELHVVFAGIYIFLAIAGGGRYSLDRLFCKN